MKKQSRILFLFLAICFGKTNLFSQIAIKGVKWKNEMLATDVAASPRFETEGLTYAQAAQGLAANGVTSVVLKVGEQKIMPTGTTVAQIHIEVVNMVAALKQAGVDAYLWQRQWLQRSGSLNGGDEEFAAEFKLIIDRAKTSGVDDNIKGISLIENNLENTDQVLSQALSVATKINNKTSGWLRTKTFLFPGAAMGGYFKNIHTATGRSTFFSSMNAQVGVFSFIYKHMKSQDIDVCSLGSLNTEWSANVGKSTANNLSQQVNYINNNMGLNDLATFLNTYKTTYPHLCNVTFWGDSGDGLIQMSNSNVLAVHKALVEDRDWKSYFYNMVYTNNTATGNDLTKYILKVTNGIVSKNTSNNSVNTQSVWNEWDRWPLNDLIIPVELINFQGKNTEEGNWLTWQTASEKNNHYFDIERSLDGFVFEKIGQVKGNGSTQIVSNYTFTDGQPSDINYYRLHQVDFNGNAQFSSIISLKNNANGFAKIYPSVSSTFLTIDLPSDVETTTAIITNMLGRTLLRQNISAGQQINISHLVSGTYFISIDVKGLKTTQCFIKN